MSAQLGFPLHQHSVEPFSSQVISTRRAGDTATDDGDIYRSIPLL